HDGWAEASRPLDGTFLVPDLDEQVQLLGEELVVVLEAIPEERERLDERAPSDEQLDPPTRDQVERGVLLEHPDGVVGGQDGDRGEEPDAGGVRISYAVICLKKNTDST